MKDLRMMHEGESETCEGLRKHAKDLQAVHGVAHVAQHTQRPRLQHQAGQSHGQPVGAADACEGTVESGSG